MGSDQLAKRRAVVGADALATSKQHLVVEGLAAGWKVRAWAHRKFMFCAPGGGPPHSLQDLKRVLDVDLCQALQAEGQRMSRCLKGAYKESLARSLGAGGSQRQDREVGAGCLAGGVTLCLHAINVQWPFSQLLLSGVKTKEARTYALGTNGVAIAGQELWLVETKGRETDTNQRDLAECVGEKIGSRPGLSQIVGTIVFSGSEQYSSEACFRGDVAAHRVKAGGRLDWSRSGVMHGWRVQHVRVLSFSVPVREADRKVSQVRRSGFGPSEYTVTFASSP